MPAETHFYSDPDRAGRAPKVDIHRARGPASALIVHGGAFIGGHRRMGAVACLTQHLLAAGITVVAPDYRRPGVRSDLRTAVCDMEQAWHWWQTEAHRWDADPASTALVGISAGAALAGAMDVHPRRLVLIYGPMDLTRLPVFPGWINRVLFRDSDPDLPRRWSALARCTHPCPTLLVHGQADRLVDPEHSRALHRERLRRGLPSRLIEEPERHERDHERHHPESEEQTGDGSHGLTPRLASPIR